jgi:hypothetical protein
MRQVRSGKKGATVSMASGGTAEGFDHLMRGGVTSTASQTGKHIHLAQPGINMASKSSNKGVWTVPRTRRGDTAGLDIYGGANRRVDTLQETPSIMHFDIPKALVKDEKGLRRLSAQGSQYMGGGSTDGLEYLLPGPIVKKFGRNFRQKKIVRDSHPTLARKMATGNLLGDAKLPESQRVAVGKAPSKRAVDMPWARKTRKDRAVKNRDLMQERYVKKHNLGDDEADLLSDLRQSQGLGNKSKIDHYADLEGVDVSKLPEKLKKQLRSRKWEFGDDPEVLDFLKRLG